MTYAGLFRKQTSQVRFSLCTYFRILAEYFASIPTMPAKSLGTLAMIYAIVELQNPLPRKTMLWKGDLNISASTSDTFLQS